LAELADRLGSVGELDDHTFESYGLTEADIRELHRWAIQRESEIRGRLVAGETDLASASDDKWDAYLDES
jgi:hypothetical protein